MLYMIIENFRGDPVPVYRRFRDQGRMAPDGLRVVRLLVLRPSRDLGALAAGSWAKLPPEIRWVVRGMGGHRATAVDFLSYLLFDPAYTSTLIELGYADARREWPRIERFLAAVAD